MAGKTYEALIEALGQRESSGDYKVENSIGYLGKWQFGELALRDINYYRKDGTKRNDWGKEYWTNKNGADSKKKFLETPAIQDKAIREWFKKINGFLNSKKFSLKKYDGQVFNGVPISISGMLTGTHLVGIGDLNKYLKSGGDFVPKDGNKVPVTKYIKDFNDYETPFTLPDSLKEGIKVEGGSGPDELNGFEGNDTLFGKEGNDKISGKKGDDIINGGEGFDTVKYEGNGDEYEIEFLPDETVRITDRVGARDGSDTLKDVEKAEFSDKTIDISPGQDISFVIDTTGSMDDDIDAVKARASEIINTIFDGDSGFLDSQIAVVGYNDPSTNTFLSFTEQPKIEDRKNAAIKAINSISVGGGGDYEEAVNAGLIRALSGGAGKWREEADVRRIILFGDAPPKDTELRSQVLELAANVGVNISNRKALSITGDIETSSITSDLSITRFTLETENSGGTTVATPVEIFSVLIGNDSSTEADFQSLADATGGELFNADNASQVVDVLIEAIQTPIVPNISIENTTGPLIEGDEGTTNAIFTVNLSVPSEKTIEIGYTTRNDDIILWHDFLGVSPPLDYLLKNATPKYDYKPIEGVLTFNPGETTKKIAVPIIGDEKVESDESFTVYLVDPTSTTYKKLAETEKIIKNDDTGFSKQSFDIDENSENQTVIGTLHVNETIIKYGDGFNDFNEGIHHIKIPGLKFNITDNVDPDNDGNSAFSLDGDRLIVNDSDDLDYETNPILNISIEASNGELTDEATVTINLTNVDDNQVPTDLKLDNKTINENEPDNSIIGNFSTTDLDSGDKFTYKLVTGNGDTDNKAFTINNDQLKINNSPNYENQSSYSILVQTTDKSGASYQKQLTIKVKNINEAPKIINQSFDIAENSDNQNLIGTINATDPENDTLKFSIINNVDTNKDGNSAFILDGDRLLVNDSEDLDYETNPIFNFNVEVSDEELKDEATITVNLSDVQELKILEKEGTATFAKDKNGNYLIVDGDKELQLQNRQGKTYSDDTSPHWDAIAVELDPKSENIYRVLLQGQNARSNQAYVWTTNSDGVITKGSGWKSEDALLSIEKEFNIDLNNDKLIGSPLTIIEDEGTTTFAEDKNGNYWIIYGDKELQLQNRQGKTYSENTNPNWDAVAVELGSVDSYHVLLQGQNARDDQAYLWTTNSDGVITKGSGWKSGDALLPFEQEFNIDLNGDSLIS